MLDRLKNWGLILLAFLAAIGGIFGLWQKAGREKDRRKAEEGARRTERKATDAMTRGLSNEQQEVTDARNKARNGRRDHFES